MKLVIISGKGGTGKTTVASAFSFLNRDAIKIDCDVDASNLHIILGGEDEFKKDYFGGTKAYINKEKCIDCGICEKHCRFNSIENNLILSTCEGCGVCTLVCPKDAIELKPVKTAEIMKTNTDRGILCRSEMEIGADAAGKLITEIRKIGEDHSSDGQWIILDGSPGIGCSVIASITNCDKALIITEPTMTAFADFVRVYELTKHFGIKAYCCINKYDLSEKITNEIRNYCKENEIKIIGEVPYDNLVNEAINNLKPITSYKDSIAGEAIVNMYKNLLEEVNYENSYT